MMTWLVPTLITTAATLLIAFGLFYLTRRGVRQEKIHTDGASVSVAKIGADANLLELLLDRIEKLEERIDEQSQRSLRREARIEDLEHARDDCKHELNELLANYTMLKALFEKQFGALAKSEKEPKEV